MASEFSHYAPYMTPYFKILLGGKPFTEYEKSLVEEIVYEDTSTGSDLVTLTISDPDFTFISDRRLLQNTRCKVMGGWTAKSRVWIDGYVSAVDVDFPEEGYPTITIHVMDKTYLMNKLERKRVFQNMSYKDIVSRVATQYGMKVHLESSRLSAKIHETVTQSYETDIQFLSGLAEEIGFLLFYWSADNSLSFQDKESFFKRAPKATLWYKRYPFDILSFRPRIIQADQPDEIEESDIDDKDKQKTNVKK